MKMILVVFLICFSQSYAASRTDDLKTLLPIDIFGERKNWGVSLAVGGDSHSGNVEQKRLSGNLSLFKRFEGLSVYWDTNASYRAVGEDPSNRVINAGSSVLRLDHHYSESWRIFYFSTHAYNEFLRLDYRSSNGIGPWWDYRGNNFSNGLSLAIVHEFEDFEGGGEDTNIRFSLRNVFSWKLSETSRLQLDIFFAPKVDEFTDNRILISSTLSSKVYKDLIGLDLIISQDRDNKPPAGVLKNDTTVTTQITFNLGD